MIDKQHEKYIPICDLCGDTLEECDTYNAAKKAAREAGWITQYVYGAVENYCVTCMEEIHKAEERK